MFSGKQDLIENGKKYFGDKFEYGKSYPLLDRGHAIIVDYNPNRYTTNPYRVIIQMVGSSQKYLMSKSDAMRMVAGVIKTFLYDLQEY